MTNHYVYLPGSEYANLLWVPVYADRIADDVPDFVNWLGGKWFNYCEAKMGHFNNRTDSADIPIGGARPIQSEMKVQRSEEPGRESGRD